MKRNLFITTGLVALGFASDSVETVFVKGGKDGPVRVNKADFDADQEKPAGERQYTEHKADVDAATPGAASDVNVTGQGDGGEIITTAAPSAPNFGGPDGERVLMDESKNAAAPAITTADQWLVMKSGKKFFVANGNGQKVTMEEFRKQNATADFQEGGYDTEEAARAVIDHTPR